MEFKPERIKEIIAEQIGVKPSEIEMDSTFEDLGVDSLDAIEITMSIEEQFEVEIPDEVIEKIVSVRELADYVENAVKPG